MKNNEAAGKGKEVERDWMSHKCNDATFASLKGIHIVNG